MTNDDGAIRFATFRLSPLQRQLTRDGVAVPLGTRAMDLLLHLTAHSGAIVSKYDLLKAIWPGRVVEENNLTVHMAALRRVLGNAPDGQPLIQTVTGRGYIFVGAPVASDPAGSLPPPITSALTGMPRPARLIGRDAAVAEMTELLRTSRIVSIVGPGGVGKTTLALHVAAGLAGQFPDGVGFADLSTVIDPARVPEAVAAVVMAGGAGVNTVTTRLVSVLRERRQLLILDNCEHVVEPVAALAEAIAANCSGVVVLVTSREGLFVNGEQIFRLPPLPTPAEPAKVTAASALDFASVRLFVERARALGGFTLDDTNAPSVAAICARLDGIPLAIEMAVPRLKVLSPGHLAERLDERFRLLSSSGRGTTPRHRTLQAMIDWSYDLLPPEERTLLHCLSVFSGGGELEAIEAVAGGTNADDIELLDRLTALADKSLLVVDTATAPRFRLLDTIRHYAARKAIEAGEEGLPRRHAAYFTERFAEAARLWPTMPSKEWLKIYSVDSENLRSALDWAFGPSGDAEAGLRLIANTVPLWWELPETPVSEGQRRLAAAAACIGPTTPADVQGWIGFGQSWKDFRFSDRENAPGALAAAELFRKAGDKASDKAGLGAALWRAGSALLTHETMAKAEACLVEAEAIFRALPPGKWLALTLIRLGDLRFRQNQQVAALANYQEGFALSRATDFWIGLVNGGSNMAELLLSNGEGERALRQLQDLRDELPPSRRTPLMATLTRHYLLAGDIPAMREAATETISQGSAIGLTGAVAWAAEAVALLAALEGKFDQAAGLAGYARAVHPSLATRAGSAKLVLDRLEALLAAGMSEKSLNSGLAEGTNWPLPMAAQRARQVIDQSDARLLSKN